MNKEKVIKAFEDIIKEETYPDRPRRFMMPMELAEQVLAMLKEKGIGWIPVTEKLPELNQRVLVYAIGKIDGFIGEHVIEICKRFVQRILPSSPGYETWSSPYQYFHTDFEITHWMPLPEPPKENDNEK